jgi:flavin-binding protein dodecin
LPAIKPGLASHEAGLSERGNDKSGGGAMSVARVTEISSTSPQSFEDAVKQGIVRATKTLRGVTSAWIQDQRVIIQDGKAVEYQVNLKITFVLEG